ncbi:MFS transporter [Trinickia caryophylli]|uniref:Sugar phosphate permease n=1 Tax=Trinickia caryophylli TaxID=28094 RepID=A0A1X7H7G5_TRICW|nr:MFS transporter [Trinickia caryophylli]PMS09455.1 MFS transporter [Trinickia caryophylli]TRX14116.1 MFS transporter [Trinickia caryophylli]WQE13934.1 MFS transporter [Trinickia caryophylli]SMF81113.1 Sugar phosphate permease [Trinickia caryophylli]GLU35721.1 MFS transporter [Trinickia caryophylli]
MLHMKNNPGASPMPKPAGRQRWLVLGLLCLIALVNNIDRLTLSIAAPAMQHELGFTATDIGLLGSAFSLFYAFGQLPSGWFVDRFGPRRLLGVSVVVWSAATAAMGTAHSFGAFLIARAWLGAAESPSLPSTNKIVTQWFPKKEQGIANASWDAALKVGPAFLTFALVFVVAEFGWRSMYLAAGVAGVVVAIVFLFFYRDVDRNTRLSREERAYIAHDGEVRAAADAVRVPWTAMFKRQSMWGMMAGFFCNLWVYQIFLVFIPMFIIEQFGVKFSSLGLAASVPWVGAIIGDIVSGIVSGKLAERSGWTTLKAKKVTIVAALLLQAIVLALLPLNAVFGQSAGLPVAVILMAFALGFNGAVVAHAWSLPAEVTTYSTVASAGAVQNFGGFLGATLSPLAAGMIVDATHSFTLVFLSSAVVSVFGAIAYHFFVRHPIIQGEKLNPAQEDARQESVA